MKAVRGIFEDGKIRLLDVPPDIRSASVLVIFPEEPESRERRQKPAPGWEERLFGAGKDIWTDEVDKAIRESWEPQR